LGVGRRGLLPTAGGGGEDGRLRSVHGLLLLLRLHVGLRLHPAVHVRLPLHPAVHLLLLLLHAPL
jgi:hypothetical protein